MMRIVHVVHAFGTGGMEKGVATLVAKASPDVEHVVVCLERAGASVRLLPEGTQVVEMNKSPGNSVLFLVRLAGVLRKLRPDVVHTRNWGGMDGVAAARLAGIGRVVHGEHGWTMDDPDGSNPKRIRIRRFASRWIRAFTCVSRRIESWLRQTARVRAPVFQIYNGVDPDRYRPAGDRGRVRRELGIPMDAFLIVTCGRLDPIKDLNSLIRAFERVRRRRLDAHLLIVGDGPGRGCLDGRASGNLRFLGARDDVSRLLGDADVYAQASLNEGISNTILEAMATGLPVVTTRVGGNPELVTHEETGLLVPPGCPEDLAAALERYAEDRALRNTHGALARRRVLEKFSVRSMVEGYENVYRGVVRGRWDAGTGRRDDGARSR